MIFFDDVATAADFPQNLTQSLQPLAKDFGLPVVQELGLVCPDVFEGIQHLHSRYPEMGPLFVGEGSPATFIESGVETSFTTRVAFGFYKGVMIELAEGGLGSPIFSQSLDVKTKRITINHVGFYSRGDAHEVKQNGQVVQYGERLKSAGYSPRFKASISVLGVVTTVAIYDTTAVLQGVSLEFLDFRLFGRTGIPIGAPPWVFWLVASLQKWLGIRSFKLNPRHDLPSGGAE